MSVAKTIAQKHGWAYGADFSHFNQPDFHAFKAGGASFCILKASEHLKADPTFHARRLAAQEAGLLVSCYHFYRHHGDAAEQVRFFLATISPLKGLLPPALDVELDDNERTMKPADYFAGVLAWCQEFKAATGHAPLIYSYLSMYQWMGNPTALSEMGCRNWPAAYLGANATAPHFYGGWSAPAFLWQVSDSDAMPGAGSSGVDSDVACMSAAELAKHVITA